MTEAPKFDNAPGLVVRRRTTDYTAFWQARGDLVARGWSIKTRLIWRGIEPTDADRALVSDVCNSLQEEMLVWGRGGVPEVSSFDGTLASLVECYQTDPDSPFRKLRYGSKINYQAFLRRIVADHGDIGVAAIKSRHVLRWHEDWTKRGTTMAHGLIDHLRGILGFGATILDDPHCRAAKALLSDMHFPMARRRSAILTAAQAVALRRTAHAAGYPSMALAQALQCDLMLRQRDVIGEWVPMSEPGTSDVHAYGMKWLRGLRWSEIDGNMILRHMTSKRQKEIEVDLKLAPMVMEELARFGHVLPTVGPVVVHDNTGQPWRDDTFRNTWRQLATAAGIPRDVRNMDTRAGAISEATDAGADLEMVRHAATHSNIATTQGYSRAGAAKTAEVMRRRVAHRNKSGNLAEKTHRERDD